MKVDVELILNVVVDNNAISKRSAVVRKYRHLRHFECYPRGYVQLLKILTWEILTITLKCQQI